MEPIKVKFNDVERGVVDAVLIRVVTALYDDDYYVVLEDGTISCGDSEDVTVTDNRIMDMFKK